MTPKSSQTSLARKRWQERRVQWVAEAIDLRDHDVAASMAGHHGDEGADGATAEHQDLVAGLHRGAVDIMRGHGQRLDQRRVIVAQPRGDPQKPLEGYRPVFLHPTRHVDAQDLEVVAEIRHAAPIRHARQVPHTRSGSITTRSPTWKPLPAGTSAISAKVSWPMMPPFGTRWSRWPWKMCRSVPQMPTRRTRSSASLGPGLGIEAVPVRNAFAPS
jgi:hypothetical protein